jgi:predicted nucleotidyltransferase component of viral defense system
MGKLFYNTANPLLRNTLSQLMTAPLFNPFRLVGGTALSLQLGHRISVDIDLFTDVGYGTIDFELFETYLREKFSYFDTISNVPVALGKTYYIGTNEENIIKLDLYYTDPFIENYKLTDGIRLATINEILAMKMDVIYRGGRKKDFWDIHELIEDFSLQQMIELHRKRYPYNHNAELLLEKFTDFNRADEDFEPECLKGKYWELIKLDIIELVERYNANLAE